jgi:hypothetical protein
MLILLLVCGAFVLLAFIGIFVVLFAMAVVVEQTKEIVGDE